MKRFALALILSALAVFVGVEARACFGALLKVGVVADTAQQTAAYALGYFVEDRTGVAPEFVEVADAGAALAKGEVDVALVVNGPAEIKGAVKGAAVTLPGPSGAAVWLRTEIKDDLRFTTVERALNLLPGFYASEAYKNAAGSGKEPKKAARKAVSDGS